jgi:serine/threonine-protein kinase RsbT
MSVLTNDVLPVRTANDIVLVRHHVRSLAIELGFSLVDQTKMVTAASELARNTLTHGGGGSARIEVVAAHGRRGLRMTFEDQGKGIADIELAMRDGYSTGGGLGLGLSGTRRLMNEFDLQSTPGEGTRVSAVRWR